MTEELTFSICGKEFILPSTPEPIDFLWENELRDHILLREKVEPKRKRFRMVKRKNK